MFAVGAIVRFSDSNLSACVPSTRWLRRGFVDLPPAVRRGFWALLLVLHVVGLRSAWASVLGGAAAGNDAGAYVRLADLAASLLFFLLKIADVPWLRLNPGWRSFVAGWTAVALLHTGVFQRAVGDDAQWGAATVVVLAGVLVEAPVVGRLVRRLVRWVRAQQSPGRVAVSFLSRSFHEAWCTCCTLLRWILLPVLAPPRAPPFSC